MSAPEIRFVNIYRTYGYAGILFDLLKGRPAHMNISHKRLPSLADHRRFIQSKPYKQWLFVLWQDRIIGSLYLSKLNEIGIFLFKPFRGKEALVVRAFLSKNSERRFLVNVSLKNKAYQKMFRRLGFRRIQNTYCLERS